MLFLLFWAPMASQASEALLVFAGAGMRLPLKVIGQEFEKIYHVSVIYDYEGSGRLGNKILAGQRPDVFIPGSERWARILQKKGLVKSFSPLAYHIPVIITPKTDKKVQALADFQHKNVRLVLGDPKACAIGRATQKILQKAGLAGNHLQIVALGLTVKQLLRWIEGQNADASIVWQADATQSTKVKIILISQAVNCVAVIPICQMSRPRTRPWPKSISTLSGAGEGPSLPALVLACGQG